MKAMIRILADMIVTVELDETQTRAISNAIAVLEKVDDLADAYDIFEKDTSNYEGN